MNKLGLCVLLYFGVVSFRLMAHKLLYGNYAKSIFIHIKSSGTVKYTDCTSAEG